MDRITHDGGCHCRAMRWRFETTHDLSTLAPRACYCDFCTRHRAAWISDADGRLVLHAVDPAALRRYQQGSKQAEFLLCGTCGVLVAVVARDNDGRLLGAVNRNAFDERDGFAPDVSVSPQQLAASAKLARWAQVWTPAQLHAGD